MIHKVFGKRPFGARLKRIETSANYKNGVFQNTEKTTVTSKAASLIKMTRAFLNKPKTVRPNTILPSVKTKIVNKESDKTSVIWFGHSSYRIQSKNFTVLVDPVFSGHASPFSFAIKAFEGADIYHIQDFNVIDLLVITHDHYDHLDYETVVGLKDKVKKIITPLGVGAHLEYWGFDPAIITELDWWEHTTIEKDIEITACPARHFSGRDFIRAKTLWASFALSIHGRKIFIGGDSGYDAQFKIIGDKHGPFDLAILENGQYGEYWPMIHMVPEETVQAAKDLRADVLLPVHWSKFALALHPWNEPPHRLVNEANRLGQEITMPMIGQEYILGGSMHHATWWNM